MASRGFTLVEVLVAMLVLCVAVLGGLQLVSTGFQAMNVARMQSICAALASARLEQLRSLRFAYDDNGVRVTDVTTNLATDPPGSSGGGLSASPPDALSANVPGFVDFLDRSGHWIGQGTVPPPGAAFVRRWSIEPAGLDLLVLQVLVSPLAGRPSGSDSLAVPGEARFTTALARTAQ